jgi:hypothetical protein
MWQQDMIYFIPTIIVLLIQIYLLLSWWKSRKKMDGKERLICFLGFLLGQIYLIWEVILVKQTGKPLPGSPQQNMLMLRLALGGAPGGLFVMIGLFYISFANNRQLKNLDQKDK